MGSLYVPYQHTKFDDRFLLYTIAADKYPGLDDWNLKGSSTNDEKIQEIIVDKFWGLQNFFEKRYKTHKYPMEFSLRTLNLFSKNDKEQKKRIRIDELTNRTTSVFLGIFLKAAEQIWRYKFKDEWEIICVTGDLDYDGEQLKLFAVEEIIEKYEGEFLRLAKEKENREKKYLFLYISDKIKKAELEKEKPDNVTIMRYSSDKDISDIIKNVFEPVTSKYDFISKDFEPEQRRLINHMESKNERNFGYLRGMDFDKDFIQKMLYESGWRGFFICGEKGCGKSATAMEIANILTWVNKIYSPIWINFDTEEETYNVDKIEEYFISSIASQIILNDKNDEKELSLSEKKKLINKELTSEDKKYLIVVDNKNLEKDDVDRVLQMIKKLFSYFLSNLYLIIASRKSGSQPDIDNLCLTTKEVPKLNEEQIGKLIKNIAREKPWQNKIDEAERNNKFNNLVNIFLQKCAACPGLIIYVISFLEDNNVTVDDLSDSYLIDELKSKYIETGIHEKNKVIHRTETGEFHINIIEGRYIRIIKYFGNVDDVHIPVLIQGLPVTSIGYEAFYNYDSLRSVTIPSSVTNIGNGAFSACHNLTDISVDKQNRRYKSVSGVLFNDEDKILVSYPAGKSGVYSIPLSVAAIGARAFSGCDSLESVTIFSSVTTIGLGAFSGCSSLRSVTIPSSVTNIGNGAFGACHNLTDIFVDRQNRRYNSVSGVLFNDEDNVLVSYPAGKSGVYSIPLTVAVIGAGAFSGCNSLESVTIPSSVTTIGDSAFSNCYSLESVIIPSSVTTIGDNAFSDCSCLKNVTIPSSVTTIGAGAFFRCNSLKSVTIPSSVTTIRAETFSGCINLKSVNIPSSVKTIQREAFRNCDKLTKIKISRSTTVEDGAFDKRVRIKRY